MLRLRENETLIFDNEKYAVVYGHETQKVYLNMKELSHTFSLTPEDCGFLASALLTAQGKHYQDRLNMEASA